jgi:hypothetical protein
VEKMWYHGNYTSQRCRQFIIQRKALRN